MSLVWSSGFNGITDPDAQTYIAAVETADGQAIEGDVALAISDFVVGCKLDGIWDAIKASCILAGARTLNGALVPLANASGVAPTLNGTAGGWNYNRKTGLQGNGTDNYINSGRNNDAEPSQDSKHLAVFRTASETIDGSIRSSIAGAVGSTSSQLVVLNATQKVLRLNDYSDEFTGTLYSYGLWGISRANSSAITERLNNLSTNRSQTTSAPANGRIMVFARGTQSGGVDGYSDARIAFYSIGESLDLEKLDTRVTRLMNLITYTQTAGLPDLSTMDLDAASYIGGGYRAGGTLS